MADRRLLGEVIAVPAGESRMGLTADEAARFANLPPFVPAAEFFADQQPMQPYPVEAFGMMKGPLTNAAYAAFVAAGGYKEIGLFREMLKEQGAQSAKIIAAELTDETGKPGPSTWRDGTFPAGRELHPVEGICVYEAMAVARWYGGRLPSEIEWEHAARHPDNRLAPWGEKPSGPELANVQESGPGTTTPVGQYPAGASALGFDDLMGNVWEWTSSLYEPYLGGRLRERLGPTPFDRVARGGSYRETAFAGLCTVRFPLNPRHRFVGLGARLVVEDPPP